MKASNPESPADQPPADQPRWKYGLYAVYAGLGALALCYIVATIRYKVAADAAGALAPVATAIGTLVGAYFGVQVGSAGKQQSDNSRDQAHREALKFAAIADPDKAMRMMDPSYSPDGDGGAPGGDAAEANEWAKAMVGPPVDSAAETRAEDSAESGVTGPALGARATTTDQAPPKNMAAGGEGGWH
jgi:hypothetical protein